MKWSDEYTIGIREVDAQHEHLVVLFNKVEQAVERGGDPRDIMDAMEGLSEYVKLHFWFENALMRMFGYPDAEVHAAKHDKMLGALSHIQRELVRSPTYETLDEFLRGWLLKHICDRDREYAAWILDGAPAIRP